MPSELKRGTPNKQQAGGRQIQDYLWFWLRRRSEVTLSMGRAWPGPTPSRQGPGKTFRALAHLLLTRPGPTGVNPTRPCHITSLVDKSTNGHQRPTTTCRQPTTTNPGDQHGGGKCGHKRYAHLSLY